MRQGSCTSLAVVEMLSQAVLKLEGLSEDVPNLALTGSVT